LPSKVEADRMKQKAHTAANSAEMRRKKNVKLFIQLKQKENRENFVWNVEQWKTKLCAG
jgi:hypothetical protein